MRALTEEEQDLLELARYRWKTGSYSYTREEFELLFSLADAYPREPRKVKSLGQVLYERQPPTWQRGPWETLSQKARDAFEDDARAVVGEHEKRKQPGG
jgi:hypothetical protein